MDDALDPDIVSDWQSFLDFVRTLAADRRACVEAEQVSASSPWGPQAGGWENVTIESFLEAAVSWAEDTKMGESQGLRDQSPWRRFATFLYCGKIYE